jgi:predicted lipoprotein with Yx(FWY)xxD motif/uncharacterized cupredoxin-like copper-binding protein
VTTKLGKTLVDAKGMTLYLLTADSRAKGKSVCYGTCAKYWPPLLATRTPKAGSGAKQALLGVAKRTGGTSQVTYRGHRLYLFKKDTKPGQVNGQRLHGFGGPFCTANLASKPCAWYAVSPSGSAITRTVNSGVQATATARNTVVTVTAGKPSEFKFKLSKARVPVGTVTFKITNKGALAHDFKVCSKGGLAYTCTGKSSSLLTPRKSESLTVAFKKKGSYEYLCTVPGHAAAGMKGNLNVTLAARAQ